MKTKRILMLLVTGSALLAAAPACRKKKEDKGEPDYRKALTGKQWQIEALTAATPVDFDGDGDTETDCFAATADCKKDDFILLESSGSMEYNEGDWECDDSTKPTWVWELLNKKLLMKPSSGTIKEYTLVDVTAVKLTLKYSKTFGDKTVELTVQYKKL